jgi:hypothetical protein
VGTTLESVLEGSNNPGRWFRVPLFLLSALAPLAGLALCGLAVYFRQPFITCALLPVPGLGLGLWALRRFQKKDLRGSFNIATMALGVVLVMVGWSIYPLFNTIESYVPLFRYCSRLQSEGREIALFDPREALSGAAVFYLGRNLPELQEEEELRTFLGTEEKAAVLCDKRKLKASDDLHVFQTFSIGRRTYVLVQGDAQRENGDGVLGSQARG